MRSSYFCGLLAIALICTPFVASAALPEEAYQDAVVSLVEQQVIDGKALRVPRVYDALTRAEALKIIVRTRPDFIEEVERISKRMPPLPLFPDVDQSAWYAPYVEIGFKHGLTKGGGDGLFRPNDSLTVSEAAALLMRVRGTNASLVPFRTSEDLPNTEGQWYTPAISDLLIKGGVIPGSRLRVSALIRRGDFFSFVYRTQSSVAVSSAIGFSSSSSPVSTRPQPQVPLSSSSKNFSITIPSIGISALTVTHPEDPTTQKGVLAPLKNGVGHLFSYPGDGGKILIYGHSSSYPWDLSQFTKIFRGINKISVGDTIDVTYKGKAFTYRVTEKRTVPAKERSTFEPDDSGEQLILYTCWPPDSITNRFLVIARPIQSVSSR